MYEKKIKRLSLFNLFLVFFFLSCENNVSEPISECSDLELYYENSVEPIMAQYCISCHQGGAPSGNLNLDSYLSFRLSISSVIDRVTLEETSSKIMPPFGDKLSDSLINTLQEFYDMEQIDCE
tara:strand:- start:357 stop:725 length:369 start_codon:yes stop_codon:yes gene_type:complete